jgi:Bifunctional DNA primase/polymerase, N-terminal/Primase C terminal 1 (PriCT-1)
MVTTTRYTALDHALRGPVFPVHWVEGGRCSCGDAACDDPGKHPLTPNGLTDATTDSATVLAWWTRWPHANIGGRTGDTFDALDVDPRKGGDEALRELEVRHGALPPTWRSRTGGGGQHICFQPVPGLRNSAGRLGPGLDIRGKGGYIILPGSAHVSGGAYEWQLEFHPEEGTPLAPMPAWMIERLRVGDNGHGAAPPIEGTVGEGHRNAALASLAGTLRRRGLTAEMMTALLAFNGGRCRPPLSDREVRQIAESVARYAPGAPIGASANGDAGPAPEAATARRVVTPISVKTMPLPQVLRETHVALTQWNAPEPEIFRVGTVPSRLDRDDVGRRILRPPTKDRTRVLLGDAIDWYDVDEETNKKIAKLPPKHAVDSIWAVPDPPLPPLDLIVHGPVFTRAGELVVTPGYSRAGRVLYAPPDGFVLPPVSPTPTPEEIATVKALLFDDLLSGFPFAAVDETRGDAPNRAHALAFPLTLLVRPMLDGPVPLIAFDKPQPRTGASLLVETLAEIVLGTPPRLTTAPKDEESWQKKITALMRGGPQLVIFDNIGRVLDSEHLSAVVTATVWEDRILGLTEMGYWPVRCVWACTANNLRTSTELAARIVPCRLDAQTERPEQRTGFTHPLPVWSRAERPRLLHALCTLVRAWIAQGGPRPTIAFGRFEAWASVLGGILQAVGVEGFLGNVEEFSSRADTKTAAVKAFLGQWWLSYHRPEASPLADADATTTPKGVADLLGFADDLDLGEKDRGRRIRLGTLLAEITGRVYHLELREADALDDAHPVRVALAVQRAAQKSRSGAILWQLERATS